MTPEAVAYEDVVVGDQIHSHSARPGHLWVTVTAIETLPSGHVGLTAMGITYWGHPREGIAVMRESAS